MSSTAKVLGATLGTLAIALLMTAAPAFAQTASSTRRAGVRARTGTNASTTAAREAQMVKSADTQITNRINALNALETRVNAMQKLSSTEKSSLSSQIQSQITTMTALQSQIATDESDNNTSSLKTDIQSITKAYRIYALILPQGTIAAAADRDPMRTIARDIGLIPVSNVKMQTFATMMLGPFVALEELRRQIRA